MRVRMTVQITGSRNGVYWPAPGGVLDLPDVEAAKMAAAGYATPVKAEPETATAARAVETATAAAAPKSRKPQIRKG
jgi:hypothetical protein